MQHITQLNKDLISIIRIESPQINSAFTKAERISHDRATIDSWIHEMRQARGKLAAKEAKAFSEAVSLLQLGG